MAAVFIGYTEPMRQCLALLCVTSLFAADSSPWEEKFRAIPSPQNLRDYMQRLSARPHHVGSPYDKDNAEWIAAKLKSWGLDAKIENFDVLFPTPKERLVEMIEPVKFTAKLEEPAVAVDPTSNQKSEQLPVYHAYSIDGEVTAPLVYVNYGIPADYEQLARMGISVNGAIVIARYGAVLARHQAEGRGGAWRARPASFIPILATTAITSTTFFPTVPSVRATARSAAA